MKNARRLIPVFALLLVTAIMLSTASYAWFTMNTEVKASGMQIQAQASSSLVISAAPLTSTNGTPNIEFSTGATTLIPMTYNDTSAAPIQGAQMNDAGVVAGFVAPTDASTVNTQTGLFPGAATFAAATYYVQEEFYIGSAGEPIENATVQFDLSALVAVGEASEAYAAAIYMIDSSNATAWEDGGNVPADQAPNAIIFVDDYAVSTTVKRNICTIADVDIPSVIGAGEQGNDPVGVKFIVRFYVDGALMRLDGTTPIDAGYVYTKATGEYVSTNTYYVPTFAEVTAAEITAANGKVPFGWYSESNGTYSALSEGGQITDGAKYHKVTGFAPAVVTPEIADKTAQMPATWYTRAMGKTDAEYTFVRSAQVPSGASQLELAISTVGSN